MERWFRVRRWAPFAGAVLALVAFANSQSAAVLSRNLEGELRQLLSERIIEITAIVSLPNRRLSVRDASNAALAALVLGRDPAIAERLLQNVLRVQEPASGTLPWMLQGPVVNDSNAIEFGTQAWGPILLGYADRLSPEMRDSLKSHARVALLALNRRIEPDYTNIYLMNAVNTLLLGQALDDPQVILRGRGRIQAWLRTVIDHGLREFASPTYYATDLNSLMTGYRYAAARVDREVFRHILNFFWTEIAATTLNGKLVGVHSRDYDVIRGVGALNLYLAAEGCTSCELPRDQVAEMIYGYLSRLPGGYQVDPAILALSHESTRLVQARWAAHLGATRTIYIDGTAAIGTVGFGNLSSTDKLFTIDLTRSSNPQVTASFVSSANDNAYGQRIRNEAGRSRSGQLPLNLATAQNGGWVLGNIDVPRPQRSNATDFTTSLLFPANADETRINGNPLTVTIRANSAPETLFLRIGDGCAGLRILSADPAAVVHDAPGDNVDAMRIVWRHSGERARLAFLAHVGPCNNILTAAWMDSIKSVAMIDRTEGDQWSLSATLPDGTVLQVVRDLRTRRALALKGAARLPEGAVFVVNGTDYTSLLRSALAASTAADPNPTGR